MLTLEMVLTSRRLSIQSDTADLVGINPYFFYAH